jgi:HAD superfamily hydrolase (TIGR01509 family)
MHTSDLLIPDGHFAAYIFDCDGTLADTMPAHYRAWSSALGDHADKFPEAMHYELGGTPTAKILEIINERNGLNLPVAELLETKEALFLTMIDEVKAIKSVVDLAIETSGIKPIAVASGGNRAVVISTLQALGIADIFDAIVCSEDYLHGKPSPDPFLEAARRLGVAPKDCLVFEDTASGIAAAEAAGMRWVLIPPPTKTP